jgi:hypothetical protein
MTGGAFKVGGLLALDDFLVGRKTTDFDLVRRFECRRLLGDHPGCRHCSRRVGQGPGGHQPTLRPVETPRFLPTNFLGIRPAPGPVHLSVDELLARGGLGILLLAAGIDERAGPGGPAPLRGTESRQRRADGGGSDLAHLAVSGNPPTPTPRPEWSVRQPRPGAMAAHEPRSRRHFQRFSRFFGRPGQSLVRHRLQPRFCGAGHLRARRSRRGSHQSSGPGLDGPSHLLLPRPNRWGGLRRRRSPAHRQHRCRHRQTGGSDHLLQPVSPLQESRGRRRCLRNRRPPDRSRSSTWCSTRYSAPCCTRGWRSASSATWPTKNFGETSC